MKLSNTLIRKVSDLRQLTFQLSKNGGLHIYNYNKNVAYLSAYTGYIYTTVDGLRGLSQERLHEAIGPKIPKVYRMLFMENE